MKIAINNERKILAIQKAFSKEFPYLKIEFFRKPHPSGMASPKKWMKDPVKTLGDCKLKQKGTITITPDMTVCGLEQEFSDIYGLSVQVFRKSGKAWLETTVTDGWTLEKQNSEGKELSDGSTWVF